MKLRFSNATEFLRQYVEDPLLAGVAVPTRFNVPLGTLVDLTIEMADGHVFQTQGEVVSRLDATPSHPPRVGVRFGHMAVEHRQWLTANLQTLPQQAGEIPHRSPSPTAQQRAAAVGNAAAEPLSVKLTTDRLVLGIDLGTSNSCACVVVDGQPRVIDLSETELFGPSRNRTLPSIVAYDDGSRASVGARALQGLRQNAKRTVFGAKRFIGRSYDSPAVQSMLSRFPYKILRDADGRVAVEINGRSLSLTAISAEVLRAVRSRCERELRRGIQHAVITVPAYYNDNQRHAVVEAGRLAGLTVERILNEPTAAVIAYGLQNADPARFLVYDLGGGTFDVSVMSVECGTLRVLSTAGDTFLGGEDFDNRLVQHISDTFARNTGKRLSQNHTAMALVKAAAEKAKTQLSDHSKTKVVVRDALLADGTTTRLAVDVERVELEHLVAPLVERTLAICDQALAAAHLSPADLSDVLLVGGQTRMPLVGRRVEEHFRRTPRSSLNPDEVVALGAGLVPHVGSHGEICFRDVLAMSIGIGVDGKFHPLIARNMPVPHTVTLDVAVAKRNLAAYSLAVWQGDEPSLHRNEYLGAVRFDAPAPGTKDPAQFRVAFALSEDCLLTTTVTNLETGETLRVLLSTKT